MRRLSTQKCFFLIFILVSLLTFLTFLSPYHLFTNYTERTFKNNNINKIKNDREKNDDKKIEKYNEVLNIVRTKSLEKSISKKLFSTNNIDSIGHSIEQVVDVNVNFKKKFKGLKIDNELYVPFSFLKEYYEISGEFIQKVDNEEEEEFLWLHVNRSMLDTKKLSFPKYSTRGQYLTFQESDVPKRARVKCISGVYEVPITTQWDPKGYFYPTQIAQYGLSYLSKYYHGNKKKVRQRKIKIPKGSQGEYEVSEIPNGSSNLFTLKIKFNNHQTGFKVKVLASDFKEYNLVYTTDATMITRSDTKDTITHGISGSDEIEKKIVTRDLQVDLLKGLSFIDGKKAGNTVTISIRKILYMSFGKVEEIALARLMEKDYESKFMAAADWFVKFQDENGGWKVNIKRQIIKGMEAAPGWYSAMGQGQAISLLSRVYSHTNDEKYLKTALEATRVFHKLALDHGVKAMVFETLPWYEEYPTTPPSYVLNGFIYSLFGLYDLAKTAGPVKGQDALQLFTEGFNTLEKVIPLYDNGHGSFYDLRHVSIPGHSPNRARWQYHRCHLEQLKALIDITGSKIMKDISVRWTNYASGVPTRHN